MQGTEGSQGDLMAEQQRIMAAYRARETQARPMFFGYENPAHLCRVYERHRETLRLLASAGFQPLSRQRILDVGCGDGNMLRQFLQWGAEPAHLAGIELRPEPADYARHLNPNLDVRCGCATELPWPDVSFDIICQHTVFTSILDTRMKQQVAREMARVLRPEGAVLWYDFMYDNPHNPDVRGIGAREVAILFPGFETYLHRITLAPPLARRLPERMTPIAYPLLSAVPFLCTHYLGLLIKR
jgi:SAM-dependent methyltransferase